MVSLYGVRYPFTLFSMYVLSIWCGESWAAYRSTGKVLHSVARIVLVLSCSSNGLKQLVLLVRYRCMTDNWGKGLWASPSYISCLGNPECWPQCGERAVTNCSLSILVLSLASYLRRLMLAVTCITLLTWGWALVVAKQSCIWVVRPWSPLMQSIRWAVWLVRLWLLVMN